MGNLSAKFNSRFAALVASVVLTMGIVFPVLPIRAHAASLTAAPRISFTFDDGLASAYTQAAPTLQKYGYAATDYVITGCLDMVTAPNTCHANNDAVYMSTTQVKDLAATYKWEIGAHTDTHPYLASSDATDGQPNILTPAQVTTELTTNRDKLAADGFTATDFATPYGDWTPPVLANIAKTFASHRGFADTIDQETVPNGVIDHGNTFPYNDYLLYDLRVQAGVTVAQVKSYIDQTIANNQWLIITMHDIKVAASTNPDDYEYNTADLDAIAAYVKSKNVQVVTINQALVTNAGNLFSNASFDTALSSNTADTAVWSTDAPTSVKQDTANNGNYPSPVNSVLMNGSTAATHLFSPRVPVVATKSYIVKNYLNVVKMTVAAGHEIAFYIDEYDASGAYLGATARYMKSEVGNAGNPAGSWVESLNFTYTPTAGAAFARLQIVDTANSGAQVYLDNIQMFANDGSTTGTATVPPVVTPPVTTGKAGDVNGDGRIDALDLSSVLAHWNKTGAVRTDGDLSGDSKVDALDLSLILSNWGK